MKQGTPFSKEEMAVIDSAKDYFYSCWQYKSEKWADLNAACPQNIPIAEIMETYNSVLTSSRKSPTSIPIGISGA